MMHSPEHTGSPDCSCPCPPCELYPPHPASIHVSASEPGSLRAERDPDVGLEAELTAGSLAWRRHGTRAEETARLERRGVPSDLPDELDGSTELERRAMWGDR